MDCEKLSSILCFVECCVLLQLSFVGFPTAFHFASLVFFMNFNESAMRSGNGERKMIFLAK